MQQHACTAMQRPMNADACAGLIRRVGGPP
jgi:hypothetical protein